MPYHFRHGENAGDAVRRIAVEEATSAIEYLSPKCRKPLPEAIHESRKSLKKLRALLRLVRPHLGDLYSTLNGRYRDMGRELSEYRDADAVLEIFDKIRPALTAIAAQERAAFRRELVARKRRLHKGSQFAENRTRLCEALKGTLPNLETLPVPRDEFGVIEAGFRECYRRGRNQFALCSRRPGPENLHEFRKRVKDHWYHLRLLEELWIQMMPAYEAALKSLETTLGEDHNLVLLKAVAADVESGKLLAKPVRRIRDNLLAQAFANSARLYDRKPGEITVEFAHLWNIWREAPKAAREGKADEQAASATSAPDPIQTAVDHASR
jgi:CHAD domain-containing protein